MAKKRQREESPWVVNPESAFDGLMDGIRNQVATSTKRPVAGPCGAVGMPVVGIRLPSLAQRLLFLSTVFPCGRIMQITGEEGVGKTPLVYDLCKLHIENGGAATHCQNEGKDQPELREAIFQHEEVLLRRLAVEPTFSVEDWQDVMTCTIQAIQKAVKAENGPGRAFPYAITVDSIMGTGTRAQMANVLKNGHASRSFAEAALLISQYMQCIPQLLENHPVSIIGTNHLKPMKDASGFTQYNTPGGKSVKFMESYELRVVRTGDIQLASMTGMRVKVLTQKNSLGPSRFWVPLRLRWRKEEDGRQFTWWDWHYNSIEYILRLEEEDGSKGLYNQIREVVNFRDAKMSGEGSVWSHELDIPKSNPVTFAEASVALENRPELLREVHRLLNITERPALQPGVDYRTQVARANEELVAEAAATAGPTIDVTVEE